VADQILAVSHASVRFHGRRRGEHMAALQDVSLALQVGHTLGVVGESGSGKSTLARAILGLQPLDSGEISLRDRVISGLPHRQRRRLGRHIQGVFQDPYNALNPVRMIGKILLEELALRGPDIRHPRDQIEHTVTRLGLPVSVLSAYPRELSGGQRQRVCIARAMVLPPAVMVCDEPVTNLDVSVQAQVLNLLKQLQREEGTSYVFIGHDLSVVRYMADDMLVLYRGQALEHGPTALVTTVPAHPYTVRLHGSASLTAGSLAPRSAVAPWPPTAVQEPPAQTADTGCPAREGCPLRHQRCNTERPVLQEFRDVRVACHRPGELGAAAAAAAAEPSIPASEPTP
jgi:ABC-type glutathione transport system ATPase component